MATKSPQRVSVTKEQLAEAGRTVGLGSVQTDRMWNDLTTLVPPSSPSVFGAAQVAWYFGAAILLVAMTWLIAIVGDSYGNNALIATSVVYAGLFTFAGRKLASERDLRVPGGLLYALAVVMTPVTVTAIEQAAHLRLGGSKEMLIAALATVGVGLAYTYVTRIAFVSLPALIAGWIAATTGSDLFFGSSFSQWEVATLAYGALLIVGSLSLDRGSDEDYSFWGYAIGVVAAYTGLTLLNKGEFGYVLYAATGVGAMLFSVLIARKVFAFAGAVAVLIYLGHLSLVFFANSALFPLALTVLGCATIYGGVLYHRNADRIDAAILRLVPASLRQRLPQR